MSIIYDPKKMLEKAVPEAKIKKMISSKVTLKRSALAVVNGIDFIDKKKVAETALKTIKGYRQRLAAIDKSDKSVDSKVTALEAFEETLDDPRQLIQRVQNEVVLQVSEGIKSKYAGKTYTWLPSDAEEPDPEHQLNYGKVFVIGDGEMPGDRIGCRCGMEIHTEETQLELG